MKLLKKITLGALLIGLLPGQTLAATVLIDSGHGGTDPGAIGRNGLYEKVVNQDISKRLGEELTKRGYTVEYTPSIKDRNMSLPERVSYARQSQADLFISIHANSHPTANAYGTMVLYYDRNYPQSDYPASPEMTRLTPESKKLAQHVLNEAVRAAGTKNLGTKPSAVYVVRNGNIPSVLIETAFLSHSQDAAKLANSDFRARMAIGIANGISLYLPAGFLDIHQHWAKDSILRLKEQELVGGDKNRFYPNRNLTRAEFIVLLDRIIGLSQAVVEEPAAPADPNGEADGDQSIDQADMNDPAVPAEPSTANGTADATETAVEPTPPINEPVMPKDLSTAHWAYQQLVDAVQRRIIGGYADGNLYPNRGVTRAEICTLLDRMIPLQEFEAIDPAPAPFQDVPADYWAERSIARIHQLGMMNGTEAGRFDPNKPATRAEIAVILDRYLLNGNIQ